MKKYTKEENEESEPNRRDEAGKKIIEITKNHQERELFVASFFPSIN